MRILVIEDDDRIAQLAEDLRHQYHVVIIVNNILSIGNLLN